MQNEPIANIDLHGLQKFYAANGEFIGHVKGSDENRIITHDRLKNTTLLKNLVNSANRSERSRNTLMGGSIQGFQSMDEAAISFGNEISGEEDIQEVEFGARIGSIDVVDEDGSEIQLFSLGTTIKGEKDDDGYFVEPKKSKLPMDIKRKDSFIRIQLVKMLKNSHLTNTSIIHLLKVIEN